MKTNKTILIVILLGLISITLAQVKIAEASRAAKFQANSDMLYAKVADNKDNISADKKNESAAASNEAQGIDVFEKTIIEKDNKPIKGNQAIKLSINQFGNVLMIPEWTTDSVGLYSPFNGAYLGSLFQMPASGSPKNAIQGPDGNIYVSDQVQDAVFMFDTLGTYLGVYVDSSDGLNNIRGIDFRGDHLFVTSATSPPRTFEFSGPHTFVRYFINDGSDPFDIHFLPDGRALYSNIGTTDNVRLYDSSGTYLYQVIAANFPEQIQSDPVLPGAYLNVAFSTPQQIVDFDTNGTIVKTLSFSGGRGVYRLENGNLLATNSSGVHVLDSATGAIIQTVHGGNAQYIELYEPLLVSDFDVGCTKILVPALVDSGDVVMPACSVYNYGDSIANYTVRMKIGGFYDSTVSVTNHTPDTYQYLSFPNWTAIQRGYQVVTCSTELSPDMIKGNDKKIDTVMVRVLDVGVTKIEAPTGTIETGTVITPACSVYNYGSTIESYSVRMKIGAFYDNTTSVTNHAPSTYQYIEFSDWNVAQLGAHTVSCSTEMTGDVNNNNDQQTESVTVVLGATNWEPMADVPSAPSGKNPKSGSCIAGLDATGLIYFLKASNRPDFYSYDPATNIWNALETIPKGEKGTDYSDGKYPKRGAAMAAYETNKSVYVVRGNNRLGFWKYQADTLDTLIPNTWRKMATIPAGAKRCKYGTNLIVVVKGGKNYLFLMKGAKTSEFYLYDIEGDSWTQTSSPPVGASGKSGYKKGSIMAYDGSEYAYALQGYYGSFFKYHVESDSWTQLRQYDYKLMRNRDGKKKKFKDGAAMVYHDNNLYCLKGGNTVEIWKYSISADSWTQMPENWDIPLGPTGRKKVKDGGTMVKFAGNFYATKGKNTPEFYRHGLPVPIPAMVSYQPTNEGAMGKKVNLGDFNLTIVPNPAVNVAAVRYNLPTAGPVTFKVYNVTGALVKSHTIANPTKQGVIMIDTKTLSSGIYILRFNSGDYHLTRKLVLEK